MIPVFKSMPRAPQPLASCRIAVKVTPNARVDEIRDFTGDVLQVRLKAPPVDGKANEALVRFIAERLGLPRSAVSLARGATGRSKLLAVSGITREEAIARLKV
jgi:uncharacterized protein (TIGR00251 family)